MTDDLSSLADRYGAKGIKSFKELLISNAAKDVLPNFEIKLSINGTIVSKNTAPANHSDKVLTLDEKVAVYIRELRANPC